MYAKKYILFIFLLLIFSSCGSNGSSNEEVSSIEYNDDEDENDNFDDEDENDNFDDEDENDNFDDEDENDNFDDEDENQEFCDDCLVSDGSNWLNLMQNYGNYTPPAYPKFQSPPISNTVWNQVNGPYASVIVDVEKTNGGFWAGTDGDTLSYSQIYFVDSKDLTWSIKYYIRNPLVDIAVDPNNSNHVAFAVGAGWDDPSTIYLSTDSGSSWNNVTPENISAYQALAFSKSNPLKVYAAGFNEVDKVRNFYIYSSENFGATWTKSKPLPEYEMKSSAVYGIRDIGIEFIETHQTNNNILYVGTSYGLLYTEDGGNTWTNLLEDYSQQDVTSIAISESNPNLIYLRVGNNNSVECNAVDDLREEEWEDEDAQDEEVKEAIITYCPIVLQSNDGGKSWGDYGDSYMLSGDSAEGNVLISSYDDNYIYNVWSRIVIQSKDAGETWEKFFGTPDYPHIPDVGIHKLLSGDSLTELYLGGIGGFFKSNDRGTTWVPQNTGVSGTDVLDIEFAADGTVFAATQNHGVWKSYDRGINWTYASFGIKSFYGMQLLPHPTNPDIVYYTTSGGLYKTTDGGNLWKISESLCPSIEANSWTCHYHGLIIDPENPEHILIGGGGDDGTPDGVGVNKSFNSGKEWNESDEGFVRDIHVSKMAVDPNNFNIFYATSQGAVTGIEKSSEGAGVFKSTDKGATWKQINNGLNTLETNVIVIDPNNSNTLYLGTDDDGLYKSTNGGESWQKMYFPNVPNTFGVGDIVVDPKNSNNVYVGTLDYFRLAVDPGRGIIGEYGIFKTTNAGETWEEFNDGLIYPGIYSLVIDKDNRTLLAGTRRGGIFWIKLDN